MRIMKLYYSAVSVALATAVLWPGLVKAETILSVTQQSYDANGRLECVAVRMHRGVYNSLPSDACALGLESTFGPDRVTKTLYDVMGQVTEIKRGLGTPLEQSYARYTYSPNGKKTSETDAKGNKTTLIYDGLDRLATVQYPDKFSPGYSDGGDYESFTYDGNNNQLTHRRRNGTVIHFQYDNLNRQIQKYATSGYIRPVYTTYNLLGLLTRKRFDGFDGPGSTYYYDGVGRLSAVTDINGRSLWMGYNQASSRTSLVYPDGNGQTAQYYQYDAADKLTATTNHDWSVYRGFGYDSAGRLTSSWSPNGISSVYIYDSMNRLTEMGHDFAGTPFDIRWGFAYTPASQKSVITAVNTVFDFKETSSSTESRTFNGLNQDAAIAAFGGGFDANGNLTNDGQRTMTYDPENRLLSVVDISNNLQFEYDPEGRLSKYTVNNAETTFLYDGTKLIGEYNGSGVMSQRYMHTGGVDEPWVQFAGGLVSADNAIYLYPNYQGSIIAMVDANGNVASSYKYGPYGEPKNGSDADAWTGRRFAYTGQTLIPEAKFYYYKARMYDPAMGRFLQTDPIGSKDDLNLYAYGSGDPINRTDPAGTDSYLVCRPVVTFGQHCFVQVTGADGSPTHRFSYGPSQDGSRNKGDWGYLVSLVGTGDETDVDDAAAWNDRDKARMPWRECSSAGICTRSLTDQGFKDEDVIASGERVNGALGTKDRPGGVKYFAVPWLKGKGYANSNSGAFSVIEGARPGSTDEMDSPGTYYTPGQGLNVGKFTNANFCKYSKSSTNNCLEANSE